MKRILKPAAILFLSTIIFTFTACSTSQISVNKKAMKAIDKIAIMKFDTPAGIKKKIAKECEESFKGHFLNINKKVVERDKLDAILKEIEKTQTGAFSNTIEIGKLSGAQALLFGEVTEYKEEVRRVKYNEYDKKTKKNIEKEKDKKFFTFQLNVRLVSATTGDVILTLKNKYPESSHEMTSTTTMTSNRERILNQMGEDLKEVLKEKK
jgi:curli biogenesis system outer membrane secretion channel CsgG